MENIATTSVCTNGRYDSNLAATVKGLLESTSAQSLIHTWVQGQPHYLQLLTPLLTISEPYLKVVQAPRVPDRDLLIYLTVADSGLCGNSLAVRLPVGTMNWSKPHGMFLNTQQPVRRFWSTFPLTRAGHSGQRFLSRSDISSRVTGILRPGRSQQR